VADDYRNLALALGFSAGLHSVVVTGVDLAPLRGEWGRERFALNVSIEAPKPKLAPPAAEPKLVQRAERPATKSANPYLPSAEVDTPAVPRERPHLVYPEDAYMARLRGTVRLRVFISEEGRVDEAHVVHAHPRGEFEEAALEAVRKLVYDPATRAGRAVKSQKLIEVTFDPYAE
jgi:protein TonB